MKIIFFSSSSSSSLCHDRRHIESEKFELKKGKGVCHIKELNRY
jgi:hypothetical protein